MAHYLVLSRQQSRHDGCERWKEKCTLSENKPREKCLLYARMVVLPLADRETPWIPIDTLIADIERDGETFEVGVYDESRGFHRAHWHPPCQLHWNKVLIEPGAHAPANTHYEHLLEDGYERTLWMANAVLETDVYDGPWDVERMATVVMQLWEALTGGEFPGKAALSFLGIHSKDPRREELQPMLEAVLAHHPRLVPFEQRIGHPAYVPAA